MASKKVRVPESLTRWAGHQTRTLAEWAENLVITTLSFHYIGILRDPHTNANCQMQRELKRRAEFLTLASASSLSASCWHAGLA